MTLLAQRSFPYAGLTIQSGQRFEPVSESDAKALLQVGHAVTVPDNVSLDGPAEILVPAVTSPVMPKRRYRRHAETVADGD